ncbi:mercuric transporter MerT family protein [Calditrichota bacterium GD2]
MDQKKSLKAALVTAVLASLCCVGPLVLLVLGVSGAWIGSLSALEPYRPFFMALTAIFLAYAFIKFYRKPKVKECADGSYCAHPKADRINKISLWLVTIFTIVLFAIPYLANNVNQSANYEGKTFNSENITEIETVVLGVRGMNCASCPLTVRKSLESVKGVQKVKALYKQRLAIVDYNPGAATVKALLKATSNGGYPSTIVKNQK